MKIFSTEKTPNTKRGTRLPPNATNTYNSLFAWKQYHQFTHSFCRDPVEAGKILPRGLCEFWKEKESLKSDISTSGCTQEGQVPPRKATPGLPMPGARAAPILCGCSGTMPPSPLLTHLEIRGTKHQGQEQPQSLGPKQKRGHQYLRTFHNGREAGVLHVPEGWNAHWRAHWLLVEKWM